MILTENEKRVLEYIAENKKDFSFAKVAKELSFPDNDVNDIKNSKELKRLKSIYYAKRFLQKKEDILESFPNFADFILNQLSKQNNKCYYCGIEEEKLEKLIAPYNEEKGERHIQSKKNSVSPHFQIDRMDSSKAYTKDNCVLACPLCNNAKSDIINAKNYKDYFGNATKNFYDYLSKPGANNENA